MPASVEWLGEDRDGTDSIIAVSGQVVVRQGMLFFNKEKKCNLRKELAGPPERGDKGEVLLRLVGGRWGSIAFDNKKEADELENTCQLFWRKATKDGDGLALAVSRLLETASAGARDRSRSKEKSVPRSKRLLRRLTSVEIEGMWRLQHAQDLQDERSTFQTLQQEQIVEERMRRKAMTRGEFIESLRKEAELQRKIKSAEQEEDEERQRFETLKMEEERIFLSLREEENKPAVTSAADCSSRPSESIQDESIAEQSNDDSTPQSCVICQEAQRCVVFLPCKHLVCCAECGHGPRRLSQCPICRASVVWRFKVFV